MKDWLTCNVWEHHVREPFRIREDNFDTLQTFLEKYKPSELDRSPTCPWIWILNDKLIPATEYDYDAMTSEWEHLMSENDAGNQRKIELEDIANIGKKYNLLSGRWLFYVTNLEVDMSWSSVAKEIVKGPLGTVCMAACVHTCKSKLGSAGAAAYEYVIAVYNEDYTKSNQVNFAEECLRKAGVKKDMKYKLDIYTHLNIHTCCNKYGLKPTLYNAIYTSEEHEFVESRTRYPPKKTAEDLAAEALAVKYKETIAYTIGSDNNDLSVEEWLDKYLPSQVFMEPEIGSIEIKNSRICLKEDDCDETQYQNLIHMQQFWQELVSSNEKINPQIICDMAEKYNVKTGKWFFYEKAEYRADVLWKFVAKGIAYGALGDVAFIASVSKNVSHNNEENTCVIKIHNNNYMDKEQVVKLENELRNVGVRCRLMYKPDIYSHLGIYRNNKWGLRPTIYESQYNAVLHNSIINTIPD